MNEEEKELKQAMDWLAGLDIHSHSEAYYKEFLLSTIELEKEKNKKLEKVTRLMASDMERLGSIDEKIEYYFNKAKEKSNDK